jgi:hypothetical protein
LVCFPERKSDKFVGHFDLQQWLFRFFEMPQERGEGKVCSTSYSPIRVVGLVMEHIRMPRETAH